MATRGRLFGAHCRLSQHEGTRFPKAANWKANEDSDKNDTASRDRPVSHPPWRRNQQRSGVYFAAIVKWPAHRRRTGRYAVSSLHYGFTRADFLA